jgi:predicted DNA-binding transcriptional regulator AlpA
LKPRKARTLPAPDSLPLLLSPRDVAELLGVSSRTAHRLAAAEDFPRRIALTRKLIRFKRDDVLSRIDSRRQ